MAEIHPATGHLLGWFGELAATRTWLIVAGMGGGQLVPAAISHGEIESWARLTRAQPSPWEVRQLRAMDDAWRAAYNGKGSSGSKYQSLGDYCRGAEIENCRRVFGEQLERVCSTCPN